MKLLIVGCGFVGQELVRQVRSVADIWALTRSEHQAAQLKDLGIHPIVGHWLDDSLPELPQVESVLVSVPHREDRDLGEQTHVRGLRNLANSLPTGWKKLVYLSTTGVFGQCQNEVVNEDTPVSPTRMGPQIAVQAERWLSDQFAGLGAKVPRATILRLAGIYGPGRVPLAERIRQGEPLAVPREGFLNLVHLTDIARMIEIVCRMNLERDCYVFSDGHAVPREEFYQHLAMLCGVDSPKFAEPDAGSSRVRRSTSKRVDPSRLISETGFEYRFADYRAGLANSI